MPFPEHTRVIYQNPVLEEVICQLRFPDIIRIGVEEPAQFQDAIRDDFPLYVIQSEKFPPEIPSNVVQVIQKIKPSQLKRDAYDFLSDNQRWKVGLASNFLALSTTGYKRWEEFSETLAKQIGVLNDVYQPSYFNRIGLRYKDIVIRSKLGLEDTPWEELLQTYISGELANRGIADSILDRETSTTINLGDRIGVLRATHFLATVEGTGEQCYVVDADFYFEGRTEIPNAIEHLDTLNKYAGRFFRWCVTDRLYEAMDPQPVE